MTEDKDIKETAEEIFGEDMKKNSIDPEAKASTTIRAYYKGFSVLFTKRNMEGKLSVEGVQDFVNDLVSRGFNPSWVKETKGEAPKEMNKDDPKRLSREHCLIHNVKMSYYEKEGKSWYSHSKDDEKKIWCSGNGWKE